MTRITKNTACTSSLDRMDEWKQCCAESMGFEWINHFEDDGDSDEANGDNFEDDGEESIQVTNLLEDDDYDIKPATSLAGHEDACTHFDADYQEVINRQLQSNKVRADGWTDNALRIQANLSRMSKWIRSKKQEYTGLEMKDEEAMLIQSTITSFAATTASELETLRNMIHTHTLRPATNINLANHRAGIVQILLVQLQERVTKPFATLQKQRVRESVKLWQNPLQCKIIERRKRQELQNQDLLFDDDEGERDQTGKTTKQLFLPEGSYKKFRSKNINDKMDFISKYTTQPTVETPTSPAGVLMRLLNRRSNMADSESPNAHKTEIHRQIYPDKQAWQKDLARNIQTVPQTYQQQIEDDLKAESAQLTTALIASNDLDNVQQMETRMMEITTLIGQFSNLVQDQQEQILQVHDSAKETKDNLDKGQENLIDAAERTRKSKHYKAWVILAMAGILMFFHIVRN